MEEPKYHLQGVVRSQAEGHADFDGPLDVILLLLSKHKIAIQDISITSILEQYLAYLEQMQKMDMEIASEFIAMASHLMYIKTKMLLSVSDREEALTEMELLIRSLEQRQRQEAGEQIRKAAAILSERNEIGRGLFGKPPEPVRVDGTYRYQHNTQDLVQALAAISERSARMLPPPRSSFEGIVEAEPYPLVLKTKEILKRLLHKGTSRLSGLFRSSRSRSEVVATFLAILELCKLKAVRIEDSLQGETTITFLKEPDPAVFAEVGTE